MNIKNVDDAYEYISKNMEELIKLPIQEFKDRLINDGLFASEEDIKKSVINVAIDVTTDNKHDTPEFPIHYYENDEPNKEFAEDNIDSCAAHNFSSDLQNSSSLEFKAEEAVKIVHGRYY